MDHGLIGEEEKIMALMIKLAKIDIRDFYRISMAMRKIGVFVDTPFFFRKLEKEAFISLCSQESKIDYGNYDITRKGEDLVQRISEKKLIDYLKEYKEFSLSGYNFFFKEGKSSTLPQE